MCPLEFGSYENTRILEILSEKLDLDVMDKGGKRPIDYALLQDSGVLLKWLESKGQEPNKKLLLKRAPTSVIA